MCVTSPVAGGSTSRNGGVKEGMTEDYNSSDSLNADAEFASLADPSPDLAQEQLETRLDFMFAIWRGKQKGNTLPGRQDLDPTEFHRLWPIPFLLERCGEGEADWQVRFAGSAYGSVYGREVTGTRVSEIISEDLAPQVLADFRRCTSTGAPIINSGETTWPERGNVYRYQRLLLPYGQTTGENGEQQVTHLLGVAAFFNSSGATVF